MQHCVAAQLRKQEEKKKLWQERFQLLKLKSAIHIKKPWLAGFMEYCYT